MKAVILAAGMGTRLRPLTHDLPKVLVPVSGRALLDRMIDRLGAGGISEVIVVTGYLSDKIAAHLAASEDPLANAATVVWNERYQDWGNFHSLLVAEEAVAGESFMRMDGDILLGPDTVRALVDGHGALRLAVDCRDDLGEEEMKAELDSEGRVIVLNKQMDPKRSIGESMGIDVIEGHITTDLFAALRELIELGETHEYYERAYQLLIDRGLDVRIVDVSGDQSVEIDTLEDLRTAEQALARQAAR